MLGSTLSPEIAVHRSVDEEIVDYSKVHVWFCDLDKKPCGSAQLAMLSATEKKRAERLRNSLESQRYVARCIYVRQLLASLTGLAPAILEFNITDCGRPLLSPKTVSPRLASLLNFSLSHSENILGFALALGHDVGIDLEVVRHGWGPLALAEAFFTAEDLEMVQASPLGEGVIPFYRIWTRKEALAKMQGHGFSPPHILEGAHRAARTYLLEFILGKKEVIGSLAFEPRLR